MKPLTKQWVDMAEGDFATANRELKARKFPNFCSACLHSRQCVEMYFKARLRASHIAFSQTSRLERLLTMCLPIEPSWKNLSDRVAILAGCSIQLGYPGFGADKSQAKDAVACCGEIRTFVRQSLGLKP